MKTNANLIKNTIAPARRVSAGSKPASDPARDSRHAPSLPTKDVHFSEMNNMANNSSENLQLKSGEKPVQAKPLNNTGMPGDLKSGMEHLSGLDLSDVKVHRNSSKPMALGAHAYAQGSDIHLASGQEKHLPHEAWHVVQQKQGRVKPSLQMKGNVQVNDDAGLEKEADVMGTAAAKGKILNDDPGKGSLADSKKNTAGSPEPSTTIQAKWIIIDGERVWIDDESGDESGGEQEHSGEEAHLPPARNNAMPMDNNLLPERPEPIDLTNRVPHPPIPVRLRPKVTEQRREMAIQEAREDRKINTQGLKELRFRGLKQSAAAEDASEMRKTKGHSTKSKKHGQALSNMVAGTEEVLASPAFKRNTQAGTGGGKVAAGLAGLGLTGAARVVAAPKIRKKKKEIAESNALSMSSKMSKEAINSAGLSGAEAEEMQQQAGDMIKVRHDEQSDASAKAAQAGRMKVARSASKIKEVLTEPFTARKTKKLAATIRAQNIDDMLRSAEMEKERIQAQEKKDKEDKDKGGK